ncbi:MAG: HEAT repeat domain-containing protein [Candidatus Methanoculleus thermohydrogenotrophicum]|jgi:HEAT repeat protein
MTTLDDIDRMRDDREIDGLIRALYDEDEFVRAQAALSLGALADPRAKDHLDLMQNEDPSPSARDAAATAYRWLVGRLEEVEAARGSRKRRT